ncbi:WD40 repeat domain-containing protein [Streptomyces sviceus]|uniref:WD40 repeat domain-containing protein n=1 Tax=Streptomyces sviceus TaxID=285530 RepID=UPI0036B6D748
MHRRVHAAWQQSGVSARRRDEAEARGAAELVDTLRQSDPRTAAQLALAAWRVADLPETRAALRTAAAQSEQDVFTAPEEGGRAINAPTWLSRDGRTLTTLARDQVVQWDVPSHRRIRSVRWPGLSENVVDVSEDGRLVAYQGPGGAGLVVGVLADRSRHRLPTGPATGTDAAFGPDGRTLLVRRPVPGGDERATLTRWDLHRQRVSFHYEQGTGDGALPAQSRDGRYLAWCTDSGGQPRILDTAAGHLVNTPVPEATGRALCRGDELTFTADSRAVATATSTGVVTWDIRTGRERPRLPLAGALRVEFAGDYAVTWAVGSLTLWRPGLPAPADDSPREPLLTVPVDSSSVGDLRLDPAGVLRYRAQGRTDSVHTLSLHGLTDGAWRNRQAHSAAFDLRGRPVPVRKPATVHGEETVTVDPAGRTALTSEGTLVDIATGRRPEGLAGVQGEDYLTEAAFSPDGRYLAAADVQGRVTLWDARPWRRLAALRTGGSNRHAPALGFSADGSLVAADDPDGSVHVWETGAPALPPATLPVGDAPVLALGFTQGGEELHLATPHLADRALPLAPDRAARTVCARTRTGLGQTQWRRWFPSADYRRTCGP